MGDGVKRTTYERAHRQEYRRKVQLCLNLSDVLAAIADPAYQTELGAYNIKFNVPPRSLGGHAGVQLEDEVRASLNAAEIKASAVGAHIVMIGILPTLVPEHLTGGSCPSWTTRGTVG